MKLKPALRASVDGAGRLVLPAEVTFRYGVRPGSRLCVDEERDTLSLLPPATHLRKVYIEPTNQCNLRCRTCIRNIWDEPEGQMDGSTFERIVEGLSAFSPPPMIFFGGFGEPLAHPDIVEMVVQSKALGSSVELITNGTLLTKALSKQLIEAGLDQLWVSLDGARPESYMDVRLGAALPEVLANLDGFREVRRQHDLSGYLIDYYHLRPQIGIVFVAMKRNIADLPAVIRLGNRLGARRFLVTNVLPYTAEIHDEILYPRALNEEIYRSCQGGHALDIPQLDINAATWEVLYQLMLSNHPVRLAGDDLGEDKDRCPFIAKGATAIRWDGAVSPCLHLLHDHITYMNGYERAVRCYVVGNVKRQGLYDVWNVPEYLSFRERVQEFDFSPCTSCGGCNLLESNEEDCFGSPFPACGGCLWAQGIIRCP